MNVLARTRRSSLLLTAVVVAALTLAASLPAAAQTTPNAKLVRIFKTSNWKKPSTDPTGLSYVRRTNQLVVCDSEVEETSHWRGANVWLLSLKGKVKRSFSTLAYSSEPTDCAMRKARGPLYITDDQQDKVFIVRAGKDGIIGTKDDAVTSFSTRSFGSRDPNGIDFAPQHSLLVSDGNNGTTQGAGNQQAVFRIKPGPDGVFDGAAPVGDDVVTEWHTARLGIREPEGVAYDWYTHNVVLVSGADDVIVIATITGKLVKTFDISGANVYHASSVAIAPGSFNQSVRHVYVTDRGVDNNAGPNGMPNENDGKIFEFGVGKAV